MWHKPCRTFHPWCPCIKTRCLSIKLWVFIWCSLGCWLFRFEMLCLYFIVSLKTAVYVKKGVSSHVCRQVSNIRRALGGNNIVDHSDVVGASPARNGASYIRELTVCWIHTEISDAYVRGYFRRTRFSEAKNADNPPNSDQRPFGQPPNIVTQSKVLMTSWHEKDIHIIDPLQGGALVFLRCLPR